MQLMEVDYHNVTNKRYYVKLKNYKKNNREKRLWFFVFLTQLLNDWSPIIPPAQMTRDNADNLTIHNYQFKFRCCF